VVWVWAVDYAGLELSERGFDLRSSVNSNTACVREYYLYLVLLEIIFNLLSSFPFLPSLIPLFLC
jgi:hypothetical protein